MAALENAVGVQFLGQNTLDDIAIEGLAPEKEVMMSQPVDIVPHHKTLYESA